jgi:hypothetical protein
MSSTPTTIYQASKPTYNWRGWARYIAIRLLFLPTLLWDATRSVMNYYFGAKIGRDILASLSPTKVSRPEHLDNEIRKLNRSGRYAAHYLSVRTHDNAELKTLEIHNTFLPDAKYVIELQGNFSLFEERIDDMKYLSKRFSCNVIGFNYRGVNGNRGIPTRKDHLVTDAIAQVQRLLDMGISPDKIYLKGFSLGGAVGVLTAKHFHDNGIKIKIFCDRAFSSITNYVIGQARSRKAGHTETPEGIRKGKFLMPFVKFFLVGIKWEMNVARAYRSLPETHKDYTVIRSSKAERFKYGTMLKDDYSVTHYGSLHQGLKDARKAEKKILSKELMSSYKFRNNLHKLVSITPVSDAHGTSLTDLRSRANRRSGYNIFGMFFNAHQQEPVTRVAVDSSSLERKSSAP